LCYLSCQNPRHEDTIFIGNSILAMINVLRLKNKGN